MNLFVEKIKREKKPTKYKNKYEKKMYTIWVIYLMLYTIKHNYSARYSHPKLNI